MPASLRLVAAAVGLALVATTPRQLHAASPPPFFTPTGPADTLYIYGGPGSDQGRFQDDSVPPQPDPQGWTTLGTAASFVALSSDIDPDQDNPTPQAVVEFIGPSGPPLSSSGFRSPNIAWDHPGTADDLMDEAFLRFDVYAESGAGAQFVFWTWHVRSFDGTAWGDWVDRNFVYAMAPNGYRTRQIVIGDLVPSGTVAVQVALEGLDLSPTFGFPPATAIVAFDNIAVARHFPTNWPPADAAPLPRGSTLALTDVRPNPFNPATMISFSNPADGRVSVRVFDVKGRAVRTLLEGFSQAGEHLLRFDGRREDGTQLASGVYLVRLEGAGGVSARAITLAK